MTQPHPRRFEQPMAQPLPQYLARPLVRVAAPAAQEATSASLMTIDAPASDLDRYSDRRGSSLRDGDGDSRQIPAGRYRTSYRSFDR